MRQYLALVIALGVCAAAVAGAVGSLTIGDDRAIARAAAVHDVAPAPTAERLFLTKAQSKEAQMSLGTGHDVQSILNITKPMTYGDFVWSDRNIAAGDTWIRVDLTSQLISVFRGSNEIATAVMLYGAEEKETPTGVFPIKWKRKDHRSATYGNAPMPYTLRLTDDGISIHGGDVRWGAATHGCIGVPLAFAKRLFESAERGDKVVIVRTAASGQGNQST